jgi:hypothetical protein
MNNLRTVIVQAKIRTGEPPPPEYTNPLVNADRLRWMREGFFSNADLFHLLLSFFISNPPPLCLGSFDPSFDFLFCIYVSALIYNKLYRMQSYSISYIC